MIEKNNPNYIKWLITNNNHAVERAILAIYNRQTADEQNTEHTKHSNGMGFAAPDAKLGSYYAKWILSGKNLSGRHLEKARMMSYKYVRQLCEIATDRMEREAIQNENTVA